MFREIWNRFYQLAFQVRFLIRSKNWEEIHVTKAETASNVLVSGFFNEVLGIGSAGRLTADTLADLGFNVMRQDIRQTISGLMMGQPKDIKSNKPIDIWLIHANPPEAKILLFAHKYESWKNLYRVGYWAWESTLAPKAWLSCAQWFHEIWVPSSFVYEAFKGAFVIAGEDRHIKKLRIMPHPVKPGRKKAFTSDVPITAVTVFDPRSHFERKNPTGSISAWLRAFPHPTMKAKLIVKSFKEVENYPEYKNLYMKINGRPDIQFFIEKLDQDGMERFITDADILISLHRAEGFGLPLAEAMANELSVIATGWSGNCDYMDNDNAIIIPYQIIPASKEYNGPAASWAEPDIDAASRAIQVLCDDVDLRARLGIRAREDIKRLCLSWTSALFS